MDQDLQDRLTSLDNAVRAAVSGRSASDPNPNDSFRGLYVSAEQVDAMLDSGPSRLADTVGWHPDSLADATTLGALAKRCGLSELDVNLLVVLLAPEIDSRFERFFAFLHDDITRRLASPGLALELCGCSSHAADARGRFDADAPLRANGLVVVDSELRPLMSRAAWLPEPVVQQLLGRPSHDRELERVRLRPRVSQTVQPLAEALPLLDAGVIYLPFRLGDGLTERAVATMREASIDHTLVLDAHRVDTSQLGDLAFAIRRQVSLRSTGLIVQGADRLPDWFLRQITDAACPIILLGTDPPMASWTNRPLYALDADAPSTEDRQRWWAAHLPEAQTSSVPSSLRLGPDEIARTVATATQMAEAAGAEIDSAWLSTVANRSARSGLHRLARHIEPQATWSDLIVADPALDLLRRVSARVTHRDLVMGDWKLGRGGGRGEGTTVLFAGPSGTGKTLAAEVIANDLGFDLYVVDLSSVVDKYIGETEKNLERIFHEAEATNAILFFDEADALFGKRSEVSDAKDRYANIEVAYLLQRMETFDGVSILATNLKSNLDEAFTRRLSLVVEFKSPDASQRLALWKLLLGDAPVASGVDLETLATEHDLAGGSIRSAIETAAYLAAAADAIIGQDTLLRAVQHEYEKAGRLWRT